jgi:hypothetical protein
MSVKEEEMTKKLRKENRDIVKKYDLENLVFSIMEVCYINGIL